MLGNPEDMKAELFAERRLLRALCEQASGRFAFGPGDMGE